MSYPLDPTERKQLREEQLALAVFRAQIQARAFTCSIKCSAYEGAGVARHAGDVDGCRNDGSSCLCDCHDLTQMAVPS